MAGCFVELEGKGEDVFVCLFVEALGVDECFVEV